jgi:tRNA(Ile)-lysidine synthase
MNGTKKVKDILINEKVPKKLRNSYPVVLNSKNEIVWIPGLKKSDFDMAIDGNYDIIIKYEKEKKNE